jgi:hypothetical protein
MKLGSGDVSFRLGAITPTKVYLGSTEVWSDVVASPPEAVASVTAATSETTPSAAEISWEAPADGGAAITGYKVYRSSDGGSTYTLHAAGVSSPYTLVVPVSGGSIWSVDVRAVNSAGEGPPSLSPASVALSASVPSAPTAVTASPAADVDIDVAWTAPEVTGESTITGYEVEWSGNASTQVAFTENSSNYHIELGYDDVGIEYQVRVRAQNGVGYSEWSGAVTVTAADVPSAPDYLSVSTDNSAPGAVLVQIYLPANADRGSPLVGYDIEASSDSNFTNSITLQTVTESPGPSSPAFMRTLTGLVGGAETWVRVRLRNAVGEGQWNASGSAVNASATPPAAVQDFQVSANFGNNSWDFTWTAPADRGSAITGYVIQESGDDSFATFSQESPGAGNTSYNYAPAVTTGTRHFRIRAVNGIGEGDWSSTASASWPTPPVISYAIGSGGSGGNGDADGNSGGQTTLSFGGVSLAANGGSGGSAGAGGAGGSGAATAGSAAAGGQGGGGGPGDTGGGGGGGINGSAGYATGYGPSPGFQQGGGGQGGDAADYYDLFSRLSSLGVPTSGAGLGDAGNDPSSPGGNATGFGAGGGAAGWYGNDGGAGLYGGGGGGAAEEGGTRTGGAGGSGVVVLEFVGPSSTTQHLLTSDTSYEGPAGTTTIRAWIVGGGGGGGGAGSGRGASGGGGAGEIVYYEWTL